MTTDPVYSWTEPELFPRPQRWVDLRIFLDGAEGKFAVSATTTDYWSGMPIRVTVGRSWPLHDLPTVGIDEIRDHLREALYDLPPF